MWLRYYRRRLPASEQKRVCVCVCVCVARILLTIAAGWKVEAPWQPWREGRSLHDILGSEVAVVEDERSGGGSDGAGSSPIGRTVVWGAARLRVIECSCVAEDLLASLLYAGWVE